MCPQPRRIAVHPFGERLVAFLKCEIGKPLILAIDDVAYNVKGKFGVQTVFHAGDDSFAMNPESAAKQLAHAGIADPIGTTLEFSKVDIGQGRTAINIKQVGATSGPKKAQPFDQPAPPSHERTAPQGFHAVTGDRAVYEDLTQWVLGSIVPLYAAKGIALDMQAIAAIVNTNFIQASKR